MNRLRIKAAVATLLLMAGCAKDETPTPQAGVYNTRAEFEISIDDIEIAVGITPITRSSTDELDGLWYVIFDKSGKVIPSAEGVNVRPLPGSVNQFSELLPVGEYTVSLLALSDKSKVTQTDNDPSDAINDVTNINDNLLQINGMADGLYLTYMGDLSVQDKQDNSLKVNLKPVVGQMVLDIEAASQEQLNSITKVELVFDNAAQMNALTAAGNAVDKAQDPFKMDLTAVRSFYSLALEGENFTGHIILTIAGGDGGQYQRSYTFADMSIKSNQQTNISLNLDLAYNTLGTIIVDRDLSQIKETQKMIMMQDNEPASVFINNPTRRGFYAHSPIRVNVRNQNKLEVQLYSPIGVNDVDIYLRVTGIDELLKICHFDYLPPFQEAYVDFLPTTTDATYHTLSGKMITLKANGDLTDSDMQFVVKSSDPYYRKFDNIKVRWAISFSDGRGKAPENIMAPTIAQARQAVAFTLNIAVMFSSDYFVKAAWKWDGKLFAGGKWGEEALWPSQPEISRPIKIDNLLQQIYRMNDMQYSLMRDDNKLGGIGVCVQPYYIAWLAGYYPNHYPDADPRGNYVMFHEFAHMLGYGDYTGNMTRPSRADWTLLCDSTYISMCKREELPIYSKKFLNTTK